MLVIDHIVPKSAGGSSESNNLVTACMNCSSMKASKELKDYLAYTVYTNTEYYNTFQESMNNINTLIQTQVESSSARNTFYQLLFSNVIASMETYLSDAFIITVLSKKEYIRKLIETDPEFKKRKLDLADIFKSIDDIQDTASSYLLDIIYHNIWKVKNMYYSVLDIEFPDDLSEISKAIMVRHDIVHRNGKQKDGKRIEIDKDKVLKCVVDVSTLIRHIDDKLKVSTTGNKYLGDFIKKKLDELESKTYEE